LDNTLLTRFAANTFWLARYMERVENLARILDVNETFNRGSDGDNDWRRIVWLHHDEEEFFKRHEAATEAAVVNFYIVDRRNSNSIASCLHFARENARSLRHLISTEMWRQINIFYNRVRSVRAADLRHMSDLCREIKEGCQTHTGITEGTFFRNQAWSFYHIGKYLERADQTTRLLDMRHNLLMRAVSGAGAGDAAHQFDMIEVNTLLRSAAGYHAFRQVHPSGMTAEDVVSFLLFDNRFSRSVAFSLNTVEGLIGDLSKTHGLRRNASIREALTDAKFIVDTGSVGGMDAPALHAYLDTMQKKIGHLGDAVADAYF
jgi:uncharacterized alpha-E superfamily protein